MNTNNQHQQTPPANQMCEDQEITTGQSSHQSQPSGQSSHQNAPHPAGNAIKDPKDWTTGDETMTDAQRSYLHTLAAEAGEPAPENLTKAEASEKIEELQQKTGRGITR